MINILLIIIGLILLVFSIIDWKVRAIPSILLTGILFVVAFLNPNNLWFGVMGFIVAYLFYEADFFSGVADIKILVLLSFMVASVNWMMTLIILTGFYGLVWKIIIKLRMKKEKEVAFIPVFLFIYITLLILGGIS